MYRIITTARELKPLTKNDPEADPILKQYYFVVMSEIDYYAQYERIKEFIYNNSSQREYNEYDDILVVPYSIGSANVNKIEILFKNEKDMLAFKLAFSI